MTRKTTSKLQGGMASKAWRMIQKGTDYTTIAKAIGHTSTAIKAYARKKYKEEATKLWAEEIKATGACEVCSRTDNLNAHHLLSKSVWPHLRYSLSNGVCLCGGHHTMDREICPHGSMPAMERFLEWLQFERYGQYQWYEEHKHDQKYQSIDYEQAYLELKNGS